MDLLSSLILLGGVIRTRVISAVVSIYSPKWFMGPRARNLSLCGGGVGSRRKARRLTVKIVDLGHRWEFWRRLLLGIVNCGECTNKLTPGVFRDTMNSGAFLTSKE